MSAIERCRTAALGGHVARCEDCAYTTIAYNSCRNRHCPKCQGAAAKQWLAEREAELLPVPYFHVVFTLPAGNRRHRLPEQSGGLRSAVQSRGRDRADNRGRSQAPGRPHRHHRGAPHLGLDHDPPPARAHDRARRWHLARRLTLGVVPAPLLAACTGILQAVPWADACEAPRRPQGRPAQILRPACSPRRAQGFRRLSGAAAQAQVVRLLKAPVRRTQRRCSPICRATPTASPSPTAG